VTEQKSGIEWLRSVEFDVADLAASAAFYADVWGLKVVDRTPDAVYLRGTSTEHHILVLREGATCGIRRANFGAADRRTVDELYDILRDVALAPPKNLDEPGDGYGFAFSDGESREMRVISGIGPHEKAGLRADVPVKLSHVVYASTDADAASAFYQRLGFRLRDESGRIFFLGCNQEHHCLAFGRAPVARLSHVAFDLPSIDGLMRGTGRLKAAGLTLEHGVGRHGPGNNVFAYFFDPNDIVIEYTTEMAHIDDRTYKFGGPEFWDKRVTVDEWGVAGPPTERFRTRGSRGLPELMKDKQ